MKTGALLRFYIDNRKYLPGIVLIVGLSLCSGMLKMLSAAYWGRSLDYGVAGLTQEMLTAAYERCADNTGKFSAAYIDRVLETWRTANIRNLDELAAYEEKKKSPAQPNTKGRAKPPSEKSYDIDELERMSFFDLPDNL